MGFNIFKRVKKDTSENTGSATEQVTVEEITKQDIHTAMSDVYIRELAFWTCIGKISNALSMCEFRTFVNGEETFGDEYYLWNYEPNRNQNKAEFISKALDSLYRKNDLLIVESTDHQLLIADGYTTTKNTLYGNTYNQVYVDDYGFRRSFPYSEVMHWKLNNRNVSNVLNNVYSSYNKLIEYASKAFLKSRGSRGILNISGAAQANSNFSETLKKLLDEYFKDFFSASNAVLPLFEGYQYDDIGSKTYNETTSRDIKSQYDDIFDFTARAFCVPPSLAKGDVQDTSKAVDEMLTFCIDPLANMLEQEINRKRNGVDVVRKKTYLKIDTTRVKHTDMFDVAPQADKLISSGIYTVNMMLRALGEPEISEDWADQHFITKNYSTIQDLLNELNVKGGE